MDTTLQASNSYFYSWVMIPDLHTNFVIKDFSLSIEDRRKLSNFREINSFIEKFKINFLYILLSLYRYTNDEEEDNANKEETEQSKGRRMGEKMGPLVSWIREPDDTLDPTRHINSIVLEIKRIAVDNNISPAAGCLCTCRDVNPHYLYGDQDSC